MNQTIQKRGSKIFDNFNLETCTVTDDHGITWMKEFLAWKDFLRTRFKLRRTHPSAFQYLEHYADDFPWGRFCLEHGQVSQAENYRTVRDRFNRDGFMEENKCYVNSMQILRGWQKNPPEWIGGRPVSYVEGLAIDPTGIFLHGWIDIGGIAYDMTFPRAWMTTYFGVHLEPAWADNTMREISQYGLFHWWELSQPHLEKLKQSD